MDKIIKLTAEYISGKLSIPSSKSMANRALILQALFPQAVSITNLSTADDTVTLKKLLHSKENVLNTGHAGTTYRFLTAYLSIQKGREVVLTGSERMKERPIKPLVEALNTLGASIEYLEKEGYPPLKISGKELTNNKVSIKGDISSQYISALVLIGSKLKNGLEIKIEGELVSLPYLLMSIQLIKSLGIDVIYENNRIIITPPKQIKEVNFIIEPDWSSASYWYSFVALVDNAEILLEGYTKDSLQGDAVLKDIYKDFGVQTTFEKNGVRLSKSKNFKIPKTWEYDFTLCPDIAQTLAVTCAALNVSANFYGLSTLKIKETDRLQALKIELEKFGCEVQITNDSFLLNKGINRFINKEIEIETYNDHRMAMAFVPLALYTTLKIKNAEVVSKSYPTFWKDVDLIFN
ncbi:MAG: 3-phosphoshikimate 1-carboxyvinyltransferase [Vicingaceae bacterium]